MGGVSGWFERSQWMVPGESVDNGGGSQWIAVAGQRIVGVVCG